MIESLEVWIQIYCGTGGVDRARTVDSVELLEFQDLDFRKVRQIVWLRFWPKNKLPLRSGHLCRHVTDFSRMAPVELPDRRRGEDVRLFLIGSFGNFRSVVL